MLEKQIVIDRIEILENGTIQTRENTRILEDGIIISEKHTNRKVLWPGCDLSDEPIDIQTLAALVHTPEKIAAYEAFVALSTPEIPGE